MVNESTDQRYPYESTGIKTAADPLRLDRGNAFKGNLHYSAVFVPALALKGVKFDSQPNQMQRAAGASEDEEGGFVDSASFSSSDEAHQAIPEGVTIETSSKHQRNAKSTDTTPTTVSAATNGSSQTNDTDGNGNGKGKPPPVVEEGVEMGMDELLSQRKSVSLHACTGT